MASKDSSQIVAKRLSNEDVVNDFFKELEQTPFPETKIKELFPDLVAAAERIASLQSVPWPWVLMCELSLTSFLAPTACLYPVNSIRLFPVFWTFFMHPGSTQTSGLLRFYADIYDEVEFAVNDDRTKKRAEWAQRNPTRAAGVAAHPAQRAAQPGRSAHAGRSRSPPARQANPFTGRIGFTQGSGSLEGNGLEAAAKQNLGTSCSFMTEGKRWFRWLGREGSSVNEAIVVELYERMRWKRAVVNEQRGFNMPFPLFSVCGALHLHDVAHLYTQDDPLGVRSRVSYMYCRPAWEMAEELEDANNVHNPDRRIVTQEAGVFLRCFQQHHPQYAPHDTFEWNKGCPLRPYTLSEGAKPLFRERFNLHASSQKEWYLIDHERSKREGKLKTKNLRFGHAFHLLAQTRSNDGNDAWCTQVSANALEAGNVLGDFLDGIADKVSDFFGRLSKEINADAPAPSAPATMTLRQKMQMLLDTPLTQLQTLPDAYLRFLLEVAKIVLVRDEKFIHTSTLKRRADMLELLQGVNVPEEEVFARAGGLLNALGLARAHMSTKTTGPVTYYFVKRDMSQAAPGFLHFMNILTDMGLALNRCKTHSLAELVANKPANAVAPAFSEPPSEAEATAHRSFVQRVAAVPPPDAAAAGAAGVALQANPVLPGAGAV